MPQGRGASKPQKKQDDQPQQGVQIPLAPPTQIIRQSEATECEPTEGGGLRISFMTGNGLSKEIHTWVVGDAGKEKIKECVNGTGLITDVSMADIAEVSKEKQE